MIAYDAWKSLYRSWQSAFFGGKRQMDRNLALDFVRATEAAAMSSARWMGRGDNKAADQAAVEAMRMVFSTIPIRGRVVIGEGERDEAPMLYIGEEVGSGNGPEIDIAVDPLEGTRSEEHTSELQSQFHLVC